MQLVEIKDRIHNAINVLPAKKLKIALDFLEDLKRSDDDETEILLKDPLFMKDYRQAKKEIRTGKTISWKNIKRNV